ncbi:MAG TPA: RnfH family protein [Halieaceae bacterium]|nr:RnfH family protein [Halieaceae bacterium]
MTAAKKGEGELIAVEVAYALPERQLIVPLEVTAGTTALEAAQQSGIEQEFPGLVIDAGTNLGIFGQAVPPQQALRPGDRVEIYRPLKADPKAARKARAEKAKARRAGEETARESGPGGEGGGEP